jgi:hypothetical protein
MDDFEFDPRWTGRIGHQPQGRALLAQEPKPLLVPLYWSPRDEPVVDPHAQAISFTRRSATWSSKQSLSCACADVAKKESEIVTSRSARESEIASTPR